MKTHMNDELSRRLDGSPVVPLIQSDDPATAVEIASALVDGGLTVIEVVMRTDAALDCMRQVIAELPDTVVGAGTTLTATQARDVAEAGAQFIVSPGLDEGVVQVARDLGLPVFPGIATATELQHAWNLGLETVKFFPAGQAGGIPMLKALGSVFRQVRFMPTGGVSAGNLADYLALPQVMACGGSWLTPADAVAAGNFGKITDLAAEAVKIAKTTRSE